MSDVGIVFIFLINPLGFCLIVVMKPSFVFVQTLSAPGHKKLLSKFSIASLGILLG